MDWKAFIIGLVAVLLILMIGEQAQAQQYIFRNIDPPGAAATYISDSNIAGDIVGCFATSDFSSGPGLFLSNAVFKTVKYPKAAATCAYGVSNNGKIAGTYVDISNKYHGFLLAGKTYTSIDHPGAAQTDADGVNNLGIVVGSYSDGSAFHGFTWQNGVFTTVDYPGASDTHTNAINDSGAIVGEYVLSGATHGFLLSGNTFTSIDYPGANFTGAFGINNTGQIVGFYFGSDTINHGFTDFNGTLSSVDYPGSFASALTGINDYGQVVGIWFVSSSPQGYDEHGFLGTPIPGTYGPAPSNPPIGKRLMRKILNEQWGIYELDRH